MSRYLLTDEARDDLSAIKDYLVAQGGSPLARYVLKELADGFGFLAETPGAGHSREDLTGRPLKFWSVFAYLIIYDPAAKPVIIARVLHGARDIEAILKKPSP